MGFYEEISEYYDYIFPVGKDQLEFLKEAGGKPPKDILDIACGTGGYSLALAGMGYNPTAVDIDSKMTEEAGKKARAGGFDINVIQADMISLTSFIKTKHDMAFCIGNSLVHLGGVDEIGTFLKEVKLLLKEKGTAVFQIINYDRIIAKGISELPAISNDEKGLSFTRSYKHDKYTGKILFNTVLSVEGKKIENTIPLFPLMHSDFLTLLKQAAFTEIQVFGDFKHTPYDRDNSYLLVIKAC
jgi:glycine/sarcosine N-methyltransferase